MLANGGLSHIERIDNAEKPWPKKLTDNEQKRNAFIKAVLLKATYPIKHISLLSPIFWLKIQLFALYWEASQLSS
jgi:hypothetical protein